MNDRLIYRALTTAGKLKSLEGNKISFEINGTEAIVENGNHEQLFHRVCLICIIAFFNNFGKALLSLPPTHQTNIHENIWAADKDTACTKAILRHLGSTVQLSKRIVSIDGQSAERMTLRVGENLYIQTQIDSKREDDELRVLLNSAILPLFEKILHQHEVDEKKKKEAEKIKARRAKQAAYRDAKKRRMQVAPVVEKKNEGEESEQEEGEAEIEKEQPSE